MKVTLIPLRPLRPLRLCVCPLSPPASRCLLLAPPRIQLRRASSPAAIFWKGLKRATPPACPNAAAWIGFICAAACRLPVPTETGGGAIFVISCFTSLYAVCKVLKLPRISLRLSPANSGFIASGS